MFDWAKHPSKPPFEAPLPPAALPSTPLLCSSRSPSPQVWVFDWAKHPSKPPSDGACNPDLRLIGHRTEGYGLAWSPFHKGAAKGSGRARVVRQAGMG